MPAKISLIGRQFGKLKVIADAEPCRTSGGVSVLRVQCLCKCGSLKIVRCGDLRHGDTKSCGCSAHPIIHGHARRNKPHRMYKVWFQMVSRCENHKHKEWKNYGGREIRVCKEWLQFSEFLKDMGYPPKGRSIERRDNDRGYCPENCYWATPMQQANNRRTNRIFTVLGITGSISELSRHFGKGDHLVRTRLRYGWTPQEALMEPIQKHIRKLRLQSQASASLKDPFPVPGQNPIP